MVDTDPPPPPPPPQGNQPNFGRIEFPKLTDAQSVEYWFIRVESWFRLQKIVDEVIRFEAIVASLTPQLFDQVVDLIVTPPEEEPYKKLKKAIIEKFADSEYTRVDKLLSTVPLGAQRPSHLLAEIRRTGATKDDKILRVCWLRRLPISIRTVLSASKGTLAELAEMADATYDTLQTESISLVASDLASISTPTTSAVATSNELVKCIEALTVQINEMRKMNERKPRNRERHRNNNNENGRPRSASRNQNRDQTPAADRFPTCWYHRNFGSQARRCETPCDFSTTPQQSSQQ